jgi:hypothetical protein
MAPVEPAEILAAVPVQLFVKPPALPSVSVPVINNEQTSPAGTPPMTPEIVALWLMFQVPVVTGGGVVQDSVQVTESSVLPGARTTLIFICPSSPCGDAVLSAPVLQAVIAANAKPRIIEALILLM